MRLTIYKGTHEIGGTCIELSHDETTILFDLGSPLREESEPVDTSRMCPDAVFVSHPHQDHYGLIDNLNPVVPVFMSQLGKNLIDAARLFSHQPSMQNDIRYFEPRVPTDIGPFKITPYLMDHSSPDSFAFLIEAGGHRVFYTGDLRAHGRKGLLFERLVQEPPENIDVLLMEGTMIERSSDDFSNESAVEERIVEAISDQPNASFLISSSQNVDRLVSAFRACKRTGKALVLDAYTAWVLEQMKLVSEKVPNMSWDEVRVIIPGSQYEIVKSNPEFFGDFQANLFQKDNEIKRAEVLGSPTAYLQAIRLSGSRFIADYLGEMPVNVIYSQWLGYLDADKPLYGAREVNRLREDPRVNFIYAHTTGHALREDLLRFAKALQPAMLIPIHTDHPEQFHDWFDNVRVLDDGNCLDLGKGD